MFPVVMTELRNKGSFALGDDDDDKVDFNKSPRIGCMATKESIRTW